MEAAANTVGNRKRKKHPARRRRLRTKGLGARLTENTGTKGSWVDYRPNGVNIQ
ncbi:MAG: hypothetical protein FWG73_03205 [Planctomycetaceae bacterium]|nr:hypothetical protein [Planctomycetaceae bacterium]